ncbi:MAG: hypothetical protein H7222_01835 [Methylotenera sp.]|nr:hypothetical protein [Oligoflexia bacterium]
MLFVIVMLSGCPTVHARPVCSDCSVTESGSPLGVIAAKALDLDPTPSRKSAFSDLDILTPSDVRYCPGGGTRANFAVSPVIDPHALPDDGSVWRVGSNRWNSQWEDAYAKWFEKEIDDDFFERYSIPTDCADAAVAARAIFARIHHLPVLFQDKKIEYASTAKGWAAFPTVKDWYDFNWKQNLLLDVRFRHYIKDMTGGIGTNNLKDSTYPISLHDCRRPGKLSRQIKPGTVLLGDGHTRVVSKVDSVGYIPIEQVNSTIPQAIRPLVRGSTTIAWPREEFGEGVLEFNWPVNCGGTLTLVADEKMPGYSREQFDIGKHTGEGMNDYLAALVPGKRKPPDRHYADLIAKELIGKIQERMMAVKNAETLKKKDPAALRNPAVLEDSSTPHLDEAIIEKYQRSHIKFEWKKADADYFDDQLKKFRIPIDSQSSTTAYHLMQALAYDGEKRPCSQASNDWAQRWGLPYLIQQEGIFLRNRESMSRISRLKLTEFKKPELYVRAQKDFVENENQLKEIQALLGKRAKRVPAGAK